MRLLRSALALSTVCLFCTAVFALSSHSSDAKPSSSSTSISQPQKPEIAYDVWYKTQGVVSGPPTRWIGTENYPKLHFPNPFGESRLIIWILAQQHNYWGAFVLGVLVLVTILEVTGLLARKNPNALTWDSLAYKMLGLIMLGFAVTAILGGIFLFSLLSLYPDFTKYLFGVFRPVVMIYGVLGLFLTVLAYLYYYSWPQMSTGFSKWIHASLGVLTNVVGTVIVFLANAWGSFMLAPAGVDQQGRYLGHLWNAVHNALWNPLNLHRFTGNIIFGAAVIAAYGAYRSLTATNQKEKNPFDFMSHVALLSIAFALFTMPFAGYWLFREIYAYRQQFGITLAGGLLAWLGIILVILIGALFLGINYYIWQRINSVEAGERYRRYAKYVFLMLTICFLPYITPHTIVMTQKELLEVHGQQHPVLGNYGVMSAKNVAINVMTVVTMWSFILWWKCKFREIDSAHKKYDRILLGAFIAGIVNLLWLGIYGYYVPAIVRVGLSLPMMATTLSLIILGVGTHLMARRKSQDLLPVWGTLSVRGYFVLFFLAFAVTWIMGLGGYRRSSLRLYWHITELLRDNSPWAFTHTIGFAANVISLNALLLWLCLLLVLWLVRPTSRTQSESLTQHEVITRKVITRSR